MSTAEAILRQALQQILVQASEADLEPTELYDALMTMNGMMAEWEARGWNLGYTELDNIGSQVTIPPGSRQAVIHNLAIRLAPQYGGEVPPALIQSAREGLDAVSRLALRAINTPKPPTLPIGSGNERYYSRAYRENFYAPVQTQLDTINENRVLNAPEAFTVLQWRIVAA